MASTIDPLGGVKPLILATLHYVLRNKSSLTGITCRAQRLCGLLVEFDIAATEAGDAINLMAQLAVLQSMGNAVRRFQIMLQAYAQRVQQRDASFYVDNGEWDRFGSSVSAFSLELKSCISILGLSCIFRSPEFQRKCNVYDFETDTSSRRADMHSAASHRTGMSLLKGVRGGAPATATTVLRLIVVTTKFLQETEWKPTTAAARKCTPL